MCGVLNRLLTDESFRDKVVTDCMEAEPAGCWCSGDLAPTDAVLEWEGRLDGYCLDCAVARCDAYARACGKSRLPRKPEDT
jgi:hypothetical protein